MPYLSPAPDAPAPTETAIIVPVPPADPVVDEYRLSLDQAAGWGIPAHVTAVYPFAPPSPVDDDLLARLAAVVRSVSAFDCQLARTRWFGDEVLWLDPEPAEPFDQLTAVITAAFPSWPPYGGVHEQVVPHLTVAHAGPADLTAMRAAERAVQSKLPIAARIKQALLIEGTRAPSSWRIVRALPLGAADVFRRSPR